MSLSAASIARPSTPVSLSLVLFICLQKSWESDISTELKVLIFSHSIINHNTIMQWDNLFSFPWQCKMSATNVSNLVRAMMIMMIIVTTMIQVFFYYWPSLFMIPSCTSLEKNKTQTQTKCPQHKINCNLIAGRGRTSLPEHKRHRCYQSFPCRLGSRFPWIACFEIDVEKPESWNDCTSQTLLFWQLQWSLVLWLSFPSYSFYSRKVSTNETARGDEYPPHHFPLSIYLYILNWGNLVNNRFDFSFKKS